MSTQPDQPDAIARRAFLRRLGLSAAFVVPVVTSFSMSSVAQAFGAVQRTQGDPELRDHSAASNGVQSQPPPPFVPVQPRGHHGHNCNNDPKNPHGFCGGRHHP